MHVAIGAHPALGSKIHQRRNLQVEFPLVRLDGQLPADAVVFETLGHFQIHFAHRQFDLKGSVDHGKGTVVPLHIRAIVLEPGTIDLGAMAIRRNVTAVFGAKGQPNRCRPLRGGVQNAAVNPDFLALENFDPSAAGPGRQLLPRDGLT